MAPGPNPLRVAASIIRARRTSLPNPGGTGSVEHDSLANVLIELKQRGIAYLPDCIPKLQSYRDRIGGVDPDTLSPDEALAYWLNLYNAGALDLAARAFAEGTESVLRVPGAFAEPWVTVNGELLTLNDIEHGKIRRFGDPRIHAALVCGSVSCPTLRLEPYGGDVDDQLDDQMRSFLAMGGAAAYRDESKIRLSRVFLWYGRDLVVPDRMPTLLPARKRAIVNALVKWLGTSDASWVKTTKPKVEFAPYDWALACSIA